MIPCPPFTKRSDQAGFDAPVLLYGAGNITQISQEIAAVTAVEHPDLLNMTIVLELRPCRDSAEVCIRLQFIFL